jgi:site-specific DNA-methyltransferase (adenine-specific)
MRTLDAESVDAVITDPPYGIGFMGKGWDNFGGAQGLTPEGRAEQQQKFTEKYGRSPLYTMSARPAKMAPSEAAAFQEFSRAWAFEAYRVLKPGGYLLAFGGTRTYHRLAAGVEDAGFEIRDCLLWLYGSGFPKSLDVSKAIDKAAGVERVKLGRNTNSREKSTKANTLYESGTVGKTDYLTAPATDAAREWEGWGTALKPAVEPIVMARKPLIGTVAENVQRHGTGAININATRVGTEERFNHPGGVTPSLNGIYGLRFGNVEGNTVNGRWPANVLLDEEAAALLDEQSGNAGGGFGIRGRGGVTYANGNGFANTLNEVGQQVGYGDSGGASRFFYVAKAARAERNFGLDGFSTEVAGTGALRDGGRESQPRANTHPTVKPVALMAYLIRMVARKGSVILDPFMGSGTTAVAAIQEGVAWIGCEREAEYVKIIEGRIAVAQAGLGLTLAEQPDTVAPGGSNLAGEPPTIKYGEELELWRE